MSKKSDQITVLDAKPYSLTRYFARVWTYRLMIVTLAKRELIISYAQSRIGIYWLLLKPIINLLIYSLFFGYFLGLKTEDIPFPLYVLSGLSVWYLFSGIIVSSGQALRQNQELIKKVYFPKLVLPLSKSLVSGMEFIAYFVLLVLFMVLYGFCPGMAFLTAPFFILIIALVALSIGVWAASLSIKNRDIQHTLPYLLNVAIWFTPVFYPIHIIPEKYQQLVYWFNPISGPIDGFRWSLFGGQPPSIEHFVSTFVFIILLLTGIVYFSKVEKNADDFL